MAASKWPKLSFQHPQQWSQHVNTLQNDFNALHTYLESNEDSHVPKYLFNILHASYSSLTEKLSQSRPIGSELTSDGKGEGGYNGTEEAVAQAAAEAGVGHQANFNDESDSESGSGSGSKSESDGDSDGSSDTECETKTTGGEENTQETADESTGVSMEDTEESSDESSSEKAETTVSDITDPQEQARKATIVYGVVAYMLLSSATKLSFTQDYVRRIVKENRSRLTALTGSSDIKGMRWFVKRKIGRGLLCLLIEFATPQLANQAIKHGFAWRGKVHKCERLIEETELMPCIICLTYGHRKHQCNLKPRCCKCGGDHLSSTCSCTSLTCPACSSEHRGKPLCERRRAMKRDFRMAVGRQYPLWREPRIPRAIRTGPVSEDHLKQKLPAIDNAAEAISQRTERCNKVMSDSDSTTAVSDDQSDSSDSEDSSDAESEHEFRHEEREKQDPVQSHTVPAAPDRSTNSNHAEVTSESETEQDVGQGQEEIQYPVQVVAKAPSTEEGTDSSMAKGTSDSQPGCKDKQEERRERRPVPAGAASIASNKEIKTSYLEKKSVPEPKRKAGDEETVDQVTGSKEAVLAAPDQQTDSSKPMGTSQPVQEVRHAKNQAQCNDFPDVTLTTPEQQTHSSDPRITFQPEPEQEVRREEHQIQKPILADAVAESPDKPTQSSDLPRPSPSEPEQELRHDKSQNGHTSQTDAPASRPLAIAFSEVDLDSTPLPDDAEAIIRQLERLKAIVLARGKVNGGSDHLIAGEKRKASEPLSAVSENARSTTPKRAKQEMPAEEDPMQRHVRENNCIPYPPENRYGDLTNLGQPANKPER